LIIGESSKKNKGKGGGKKKSIDGDFSNVKTSNLYHVQVP
jgi:hypothetical protein